MRAYFSRASLLIVFAPVLLTIAASWAIIAVDPYEGTDTSTARGEENAG